MINLNTKMKEPSTQGLSIIYDYFQARYDNPKFEWVKYSCPGYLEFKYKKHIAICKQVDNLLIPTCVDIT